MSLENTNPLHGGDLVSASERYGIALDQWLDCSTGINPDSYPIPVIPEKYFHHLPARNDDALMLAAKNYYQVDQLLLAAGSQPVIETLPAMRQPCRVAIPDVGYQEHIYHWRRCGHEVILYSGFNTASLHQIITRGDVDCAVVINPNNPTGVIQSIESLKQWQQILSEKGGWLIIDEAFIDTQSDKSFSPYSELPGVVVLRSVGKFFGLAGIRIGFALAEKSLLKQISSRMVLWSVSGVSQFVATRALADQVWQREAKQRLFNNSAWMLSVLESLFSQQKIVSTAFFISVIIDKAAGERVAEALACAGILIRQWPMPDGEKIMLRFGLLSKEADRERFVTLLQQVCSNSTNAECDRLVSP